MVSRLADLPELRDLRASFPRLPTDLRARVAYAHSAKWCSKPATASWSQARRGVGMRLNAN